MKKTLNNTESSNSTKPVLCDGFFLITLSEFVTRINQSGGFRDSKGNYPYRNTTITPKEATNLSECYRTIIRYNDFIKQELTIEMFIGEHKLFDVTEEYLNNNIYDENGFFYAYNTIQDLAEHDSIKLSRKAINQIGIIA
jgi:hypothetical protein